MTQTVFNMNNCGSVRIGFLCHDQFSQHTTIWDNVIIVSVIYIRCPCNKFFGPKKIKEYFTLKRTLLTMTIIESADICNKATRIIFTTNRKKTTQRKMSNAQVHLLGLVSCVGFFFSSKMLCWMKMLLIKLIKKKCCWMYIKSFCSLYEDIHKQWIMSLKQRTHKHSLLLVSHGALILSLNLNPIIIPRIWVCDLFECTAVNQPNGTVFIQL